MRRVLIAAVLAAALLGGTARSALAYTPDLVFTRQGHIWMGGTFPAAIPGPVTSDPARRERLATFVPGAMRVIYSSDTSPGAPHPGTWQLYKQDLFGSPSAVTNQASAADNANGVGVSTVNGDGSVFAWDFRLITSSSMWWQTPKLYRLGAGGTPADTPVWIHLSSGAPAAEPAWWPSGPYLAVSREDIGDDYNNIWLVRDSGSVFYRLTPASHPGDRWESPAWSPSGEWLTASRSAATGSGVYKMRFDGTSRARLTVPPAGSVDYRSAWTDDGQWVVFDRWNLGADTHQIYKIHASPAPGELPALVYDDAADPSCYHRPTRIKPWIQVTPSLATYSATLGGVKVKVKTGFPGAPAGSNLDYWRRFGKAPYVHSVVPPVKTYAYTVKATSWFYVRWSGDTTDAPATAFGRVTVRPLITAAGWKSSWPAGKKMWIFAQVRPPHVGQRLYLQRMVGTRWKTVTSRKLAGATDSSYALFGFTPSAHGTYKMRLYFSADSDHAGNYLSKTIYVN